MSRSVGRLRSSGEGLDRRGSRHLETTMPKYLLLKRRAERPPSGQRHARTTTPVAPPTSRERKVMDPQEITECRTIGPARGCAGTTSTRRRSWPEAVHDRPAPGAHRHRRRRSRGGDRVLGRTRARIGGRGVEGGAVDRINGLEGVRADIAMLRTPDGNGSVELAKYRSPAKPPARKVTTGRAPRCCCLPPPGESRVRSGPRR
jgi:hypothetical protein